MACRWLRAKWWLDPSSLYRHRCTAAGGLLRFDPRLNRGMATLLGARNLKLSPSPAAMTSLKLLPNNWTRAEQEAHLQRFAVRVLGALEQWPEVPKLHEGEYLRRFIVEVVSAVALL